MGGAAGEGDEDTDEEVKPEFFNAAIDRVYKDDAESGAESESAATNTRFRIHMRSKVTQRAKPFKVNNVRPLVRQTGSFPSSVRLRVSSASGATFFCGPLQR